MVRLEREIERLEARLDRAGTQAIDELATVRRGLASSRPRELGIELPDVRIGFACKQRWDDMIGDDRVRACAGCDRPVFNLSAMTRAEAEAVLATRGLTPCVRFYRRPDGTVMTTDCPTGSRRGSRRLAVVASSLAAGATLAVAPAAGAEPPQTVEGSAAGSAQPGIAIDNEPTMGIPVERESEAHMGIIIIEDEAKPAVEWSVWGRLGVGVAASQRTDVVARSVTVSEPMTASTSTWEAAVAADLTFRVARDGDLRLGAWGEVRTTSGPVAGAELVVEGLPPHPYDSRIDGTGSLVLRAGANAHVVTGELGFGYVGSWGPSSIRWARHLVGARVIVSANRAIDEPHDWSATIGLELEPIGAVHAVLDLVTGR